MSEWEIRFSKSKQAPYFFNSNTKESKWESPAGMTEDQVKQLPGSQLLNPRSSQLRASHLLLKHRGSRSARNRGVPMDISKFDEPDVAMSKILAYKAQLQAIPDDNERFEKFKQLAAEHSYCSSYANGGNLGWFEPDQMQKPFTDGTLAVAVGQLGDNVVSTDSGYHLIWRTG